MIMTSTIEDLTSIFKLYQEASTFQKRMNMITWPRFSKEMVIKEIEEKKQFKFIINKEIACVWAIAFEDPHIWGEKNTDPAIYIHRIATHPSYRGNNFVKKMVAWGKEYAQSHQKKFIRLDTVGENTSLIRHYKKCGFNFLGLYQLTNTEQLPAHYLNAKVSLFEITL